MNQFKNNIKIAFRNLIKKRVYTIINILGLAVGLASCIHLVLFVQDEFSYDKFFTDSDHIYRMVMERQYTDRSSVERFIPHSFADVAVEDYPEVESATTYAGPFNNMLITYKTHDNQELKFYENVIAADSNFFSFFDFKMLKGNPKTALKEPSSMVLTETAAKKHFGDQEALGKIIHMGRDDFKVTGVCQDIPENTHIKFGFLMSINTIRRFNYQNFTRQDVGCYYKIKPGTDIKALENKFPGMVDKYAAAEAEQINKISWEDYKKAGNGFTYFLVPLEDVYLHPDDIGGMKASGNITSTHIMMIVAGLIFLLACINFINLATARSTERAKEVGVRKVLGSQKRQLITQFLTESVALSLIGVLIAVFIVLLTQPYFNDIAGKSLSITFDWMSVSVLLLVALFVGVMAGLYPAFVMSSMQPTKILKGKITASKKGKWVRDGLVIFQFSISIVLVISMMVMQDQIRYLLNKDLGYDKEQLLVVTGDFHMQPKFAKTFVNELRALPEVKAAAGTLSVPGMGLFRENGYHKEGSSEVLTALSMLIGDQFAEVLGVRLKEGKFFSEETNDSLSVLLNVSAVKALGLENPVGENIVQVNDDGTELIFRIIGVVEDFNFDYLYNEISPLILNSNEVLFSRSGKLVARLNPNVNMAVISKVEKIWKRLKPEQPFTYEFVDQIVDSFYKKEQRLVVIFKIFSGLSIYIACLGLFALSAYTASLRTKEIGIRKVNGASVGSIVALLANKFTLMVLISFMIAIPVAWYCLENWWLNSFAYRVSINITTILIAGALTLLLAWITVSYQTIKAAMTNPVKTLADE